MSILVQKFGGTSLADAHRIHLAARRAVRAKLDGRQIVMVASAMGHTTDRLVELAARVTRRPARREMDMLLSTGEQVSVALLAMAIHEAGQQAISLTGAQIGMLTDSAHTAARIQSIDGAKIRSHLELGRIVIVAGFQGVDPDFNITTLGRGGSDTTAVALAAALRAEMCEIYTDVDGVYTSDPRVVPLARRIEAISYDEMLEMASLGAGVMHSRSIELGKKFDVPIHVRSSFTDTPGTMIMSQPPGMEEVVVRGATLKPNVARVTFHGLPNQPGVSADVFSELSARRINIDDIIQNVSTDGRRVTVAFTVSGDERGEAEAVAALIGQRHPGVEVSLSETLSRVSVVGVGMRSHSGVAARLFKALADARINVENISTSEIVISVLTAAADGERAVQAAHAAFGLAEGAGQTS
ncbi:MAG: aspartate kinase [Phycisphaerales bacterium]|nr:aspartate kinase [Phycisphaerales bacterium]